jgi:hypothetical protein
MTEMTEGDWLTSTNPEAKLLFLRDWLRAQPSYHRKTRLFSCVCCRRIWHLLPDERSRQAVVLAEDFADHTVPLFALENVWRAAEQVATEAERAVGLETAAGARTWWRTWDAKWASVDAARAASWTAWNGPDTFAATVAASWHAARAMWAAGDLGWEEERAEQATLLGELFGNPFRSYAAPAQWPADLVKMATELYGQDRGHFGLRYLLEGYGYTELAQHFIDPDDWHPRGCWVIDFILGKHPPADFRAAAKTEAKT